MTKKLSEDELDVLSEKQVAKISGGYFVGDPCPKCGAKLQEWYNEMVCPNQSCGFHTSL